LENGIDEVARNGFGGDGALALPLPQNLVLDSRNLSMSANSILRGNLYYIRLLILLLHIALMADEAQP
jgi:hypothetical protein